MDLKGHLQLFLQRSLFRKYLNYSRPDSVEKYFNFFGASADHNVQSS